MNNKRVELLLVFLLALLVGIHSQHPSGFTITLNSDLTAVPVTAKSAGAEAAGVELGYTFSPGFSMAIGWENRLLLDELLSGFEQKNGMSMGADLRLWANPSGYSSLVLNIKAVKGFANSGDVGVSSGLRWFFTESFFLGTGIRYDHWKTNPLRVRSEQSLNWYWQLGLRYRIGKKKH